MGRVCHSPRATRLRKGSNIRSNSATLVHRDAVDGVTPQTGSPSPTVSLVSPRLSPATRINRLVERLQALRGVVEDDSR
jgi:hypothetical protein